MDFFQIESHSSVMPRDVHFLYIAERAAAEDLSFRVSVFAWGAMCVSCNFLSLHISVSVSVSVSVGNCLIP
jgi:hypothetical protein